MSDHFSGPRALAEPVADISDVFAFPSPDRPGRLVMIMDVFGKAGPTAIFSDAVIYRFRLRPLEIARTGADAAFAVGSEEFVFDVTFDVPDASPQGAVQRATCTAPDGRSVEFRVGDDGGGAGNGMRVFAGQRSEPFFLDAHMILKTWETGRLSFKEVGSDTLYGTNVLAIVLEIERRAFLRGGPLFGLVCETLRASKAPVRIERVGRPEIKNISLGMKVFDRVNRDLEIRDIYNSEDAFALLPDYLSTYRARLNANLAFYDALDDKIDWPVEDGADHPLTKLLLADFLVIDPTKPFAETSYLEIETALRAGRTYASPGGRWLNEDVMDLIFTLYVTGGNGPPVNDGIHGPIAWSSRIFPYMAPPNPLRVGDAA